MNINYIIQLISESVLSIYPIIIKLSTLSIELNTFIRLSSYFIISAFFANWNIIKSIGFDKILILSIVNVIHVLTSYYGNRNLNISLATPIFYTYPFINLIFSILFLNETIPLSKFLFSIPILFAIFNLYKTNKITPNLQNFNLGIPMIITSAITESILYILIKNINIGGNLWNNLFITNFLGAILYGIYYLYNDGVSEIKNALKDNKKKELINLILINIFVGFFGYSFRFYSIPLVQSYIYTIISYFGIIMSVFYSGLLNLETINQNKIISIIILVLSLFGMKII